MNMSMLQKCGAFSALAALAAMNPAHAAAPEGSGDAIALATVQAVNAHEIAAADIALSKQVSEAVAEYARMMKDEHSKNQQQTSEVARRAAITPVESSAVVALKSKTQTSREKLRSLNGMAFENAYVEAMVDDHAEVLEKLDGELIPAASNSAVVEHLRATRGHVAHHLELAESLDSEDSR